MLITIKYLEQTDAKFLVTPEIFSNKELNQMLEITLESLCQEVMFTA